MILPVLKVKNQIHLNSDGTEHGTAIVTDVTEHHTASVQGALINEISSLKLHIK